MSSKTLGPLSISSSLDNKAPSISKRIKAMSNLASKGWKIGLRFDPLIHGRNWKVLYKEMLENIYKSVPLESIHSVSFGPLRFPKEMFKDIFKLYPDEPLFSGPLSNKKGMVAYDLKIEKEMASFCKRITKRYVHENQIFQCFA